MSNSINLEAGFAAIERRLKNDRLHGRGKHECLDRDDLALEALYEDADQEPLGHGEGEAA